jgi:RNA polymerase sigma factor (sigma-70 family)
MPLPPDEQAFLDLLRAGDQQAARKVFHAYVNRLLHLARERLSQRLARRIDPEDVVQSAFRTFFLRVQAGQFTFDEEDDLGRILTSITVHKVLRQVAFHRAAKRDPGREAEAPAEAASEALQVCAAGPAPEATVAFLDQLERLHSWLSPRDRRVLEMRLQGHGNDEIARELGTSDRHIRRVLKHIRGLVEESDQPAP